MHIGPFVIVEWTRPTGERMTISSENSLKIICNFLECYKALKEIICAEMLSTSPRCYVCFKCVGLSIDGYCTQGRSSKCFV